jgi:predicted dehydrogenase
VSAGSGRRPLGVAVAGFGWMGRAEQATAQYGFATATRDWRELAADPAVEAVSIAAPNFLRPEIGVARGAVSWDLRRMNAAT